MASYLVDFFLPRLDDDGCRGRLRCGYIFEPSVVSSGKYLLVVVSSIVQRASSGSAYSTLFVDLERPGPDRTIAATNTPRPWPQAWELAVLDTRN